MTDQELRNLVESNAIAIAELRASQEKTDEQIGKLKASQEKTDEQMKKTDARLDRLCKLYGNSENKKGREVEEFFFRYFEKKKSIQNITFDDVERNRISEIENSEHDIVLMNGSASAVISVKYELKKEDIDHLLTKEIPRFERLFLKYAPHPYTIYSGVATYIVPEGVEEYAIEKGVFLFTRSGNDVELRNPLLS